MCWEPTIVYPCGCPNKDPINDEILRCGEATASEITCTGNELKKLYRDYAPESWTPQTPCDGEGGCPNQPSPFLKPYYEVIDDPLELAHWREKIEKHLLSIQEPSRRNREIRLERASLAQCPEYQAMLQKLKTAWVISPEEREARNMRVDEPQEDKSEDDESKKYESPADRMKRLDNLLRDRPPIIRSSPYRKHDDYFSLTNLPDDGDDHGHPLLELPMMRNPKDVSKKSRSQKVFDRIKGMLSLLRDRQPSKK